MEKITHIAGTIALIAAALFLLRLLIRWALAILKIPLPKWWMKLGAGFFVGGNLLGSTQRLFKEIEKKEVRTDTLAEVAVNVFKRLTLVGVVGVLLAVIPILLLVNQNYLLGLQNKKIDNQNNLIEADRRGALILLMSNIMDQMDREIRRQEEEDKAKYDSIGYRLSDPLIGRIAALSQGFLPYRYLEGDTLVGREVSPERGQLLLALVKSDLDSVTYDKIFSLPNLETLICKARTLSERTLLERTLAERTFVERTFAERTLLERTFSERTFAERTFAERTLLERTFAERTLSKRTLAKRTLAKRTFSERTLAKRTFSKRTLAKRTLAKRTLAERTLAERTLTERSFSERTFAERSFAERTFAERTLRK